MQSREKKKLKLVAVLVGALICFGGTSTVLAYESPTVIDEKKLSEEKQEKVDWVEFTERNDIIDFEELPYDESFKSEDGIIYEIKQQGQEKRVSCKHNYVSGTYTKHVPAGAGCNVKYYNAKRCTKCGYIIPGSFIRETKYASCPHK